jgi:hypothetical protein
MSLKPLSSIEAPNLINFDRDTVATEIMTRMKNMPGWQDIWVSEQYQDASQFVIQTFVYLFEKIANANNKNIRENFLSECFSDKAVYANLNQMKVTPIQNKTSSVELVGKIQNGLISQTIVLDRNFKIYTTDIKGSSLVFEVIPKDSNGNYNYLESVIIEPTTYAGNTFRVTAYAGETQTATTTITQYDLEHLKIELSYTDIIDGSIEVYYRSVSGIYVKLIKTTSFVTSPYVEASSQLIFPNGVPHYIVKYTVNGGAEIIFGSADFGGAFTASTTDENQNHVGGSIVVFCRTGGGANTNIPANRVNYSTELERYGDTNFQVVFSNPFAAYGGENAETTAEAKVYAPLRAGREGTAILVDDAKNILYKSIVKHEIETPKYIDSNVPILHCYHYIVPKRSFKDWTPVIYETDETFSSYVNRLFIDINDFLSVKGTNDSAVTLETAHTFATADIDNGYDFIHTLEIIKPLSNSLSLTAWDYEGDLVDQISWSGNYPNLKIILSNLSTDHAVIDTASFTALYIQNGLNDKIKFKLDDMDYTFVLSINPGVSVSIEDIVDNFQAQMQTLILTAGTGANTYFSQYTYYTYFTVVTDTDGNTKIRLSSPRTGKASKIEILSHDQSTAETTNLYNMLSIAEGVYYPPYGTEKVFIPQGSTYYHSSGEIKTVIDPSLINDQEYELAFNSSWEQNTGSETGPIFTFALEDDIKGKLIKIVPNTIVSINAYDNNNNLLDSFTFDGIVADDKTPGAIASTGTIFDSTNANVYFDDVKSLFSIKLLDGVEVPLYVQSYPIITAMKIYKNGTLFKTIHESDCSEKDTDNLSSWTQNTFSADGKYSYLPIDFTDFVTYSGTPAGWTQVIITRNQAGGNSITLTGNGIKTLQTLLAEITAQYAGTGDVCTFTVQGNSAQILANGATIVLEMPSTVPTYDLIAYKTVAGVEIPVNKFTFTYGTIWNCVDVTDTLSNVPVAGDRCVNTDVAPVYENKKILFAFKIPTLDEISPTYYGNGFAAFSYIKIIYQRKLYSYITAAYTPNPYNPTLEAKEYLSLLRDSSTKLLGLEHLIKDITYAPVGGTLTLTIAPGYSETNVYNLASNIILSKYGYNNTNAGHTIGNTITLTALRALLLKELAKDYGLEDVAYSNGTLYDTLGTTLTDNTYFFIPDEDMLLAIKTVEEENSDVLTGLTDLFQMKIKVTTRARVI